MEIPPIAVSYLGLFILIIIYLLASTLFWAERKQRIIDELRRENMNAYGALRNAGFSDSAACKLMGKAEK